MPNCQCPVCKIKFFKTDKKNFRDYYIKCHSCERFSNIFAERAKELEVPVL